MADLNDAIPVGGQRAIEAVVEDNLSGYVSAADGSNLTYSLDSDGDTQVLNTINGYGVPQLNDVGEVLSEHIPDLAITQSYVVADKSERLSLDAEEGDIAIQQDTEETHIFAGGDPSNDSDWSTFASPSAPIQSVYGRTGDITAQEGDYDLAQLNNVGVTALLEGADSDKPSPGTAGQYYYATDTRTLYRDDGASWVRQIADTASYDPPALMMADEDVVDNPVRVPAGGTLKIYRWGAFLLADGTAPSGLEVQVLDGSDTVQANANTADQENRTSPVVSVSNSSSSLSVFKLRTVNATGTDYTTDGVGTLVDYEVVA